jgi:selenide,water dikinase
MLHSSRAAAEILRRHGVHAATDVTGFGLLGHLVEMVRASDVDVTIAPGRVPLLDGARETVAQGIFSSLQPQNVRLRRAIRNLDVAAAHPLYPLLFDPHTAGGLLASVPFMKAEACITALRSAGYAHASVIGTVSQRGLSIEPVSIDWDGTALDLEQAQLTAKYSTTHATPERSHAEEPIH